MPCNDEQIDRMLEKEGEEREDCDYYYYVKYCMEELQSYGMTVETLNDRYEKIVFPDGSYINMQDLYLYDTIMYDETGKKQVENGCTNNDWINHLRDEKPVTTFIRP
ncbi:MAG: hypothetical protein LIP01_07305 [Tannerellaceae bacterium]|nr:hypothetical protein [Tannerellaceae bacterium]